MSEEVINIAVTENTEGQIAVTITEVMEPVSITVVENVAFTVGPKGDKGDPGPPGADGIGSLQVVQNYSDIDFNDTTKRMILVKTDEQNNNGYTSLYAFDGVGLTQLVTV